MKYTIKQFEADMRTFRHTARTSLFTYLITYVSYVGLSIAGMVRFSLMDHWYTALYFVAMGMLIHANTNLLREAWMNFWNSKRMWDWWNQTADADKQTTIDSILDHGPGSVLTHKMVIGMAEQPRS